MICPTTFRFQEGIMHLTESGMQAYGRSSRSYNIQEGLVQTIQAFWELWQCSPLQQSARGVLQVNSKCPSGMLIFIHPLQPVSTEDHAGSTPWLLHVHLHRWQAHKLRFTDDIDLMGGSSGELQDPTNRLVELASAHGMEVCSEKSKIWPRAWITSVQISI